jgi:glycosyltransferase involved in cell wall biosynthesis
LKPISTFIRFSQKKRKTMMTLSEIEITSRISKVVPQLSIVIPCKNEVENLPKLIASLERQTYPLNNTVIYVADAASTDGTLEYLETLTHSETLNIEVIAGGYPSVGRNNGARQSNSTYILFLDADVELLEDDFIEKVLETAELNQLDCVGTFIKGINPTWQDVLIWKAMSLALYLYPIMGPFNAGMCVFMRRSAFEQFGGFDEHIILGEDVDLTSKVNKEKFGIVNRHILTSNRRFKKMGYLKTMHLYIMARFSKFFRQKDNYYYFEVKQP